MGGCFTIAWIQSFLVWIVIVSAVIAIIRLVVPWLASWIGIPLVVQIINIILWAVVAIIAINIIFMLLGCLLGSGGSSGGFLNFPAQHH